MVIRYPLMPKEESQKAHVAIRHVLLDVWDPVRVNDEPNAQDEYDLYIGAVFELLVTGGSDQAITDYLDGAVAAMGMDGSRVSLQTVVKALRAIDWPGKSSAAIKP